MTIREELERQEHEMLSPYAAFSDESQGRDVWEEPCDIRPVYQRDRDRILHCKSFRRLKHKTQVFLAPEGDHYRTRLTHTLEVAQIARTITKALRLNESLTEAIALGHDIGHTPFGHSGERALDELCPEGFAHYRQSVRVVEVIEKNGRGLNLTKEVRDGILNHRTSGRPSTMEGKVVRYADKIAYINHDIDDAINAGLLTEEALPGELTRVLGHSVRERLDVMIHALIFSSRDQADIRMEPEIEEAMMLLRRFMFENVYRNEIALREEERARELLKSLYYYYLDAPEKMSAEYVRMWEEGVSTRERAVCDYIAGMSDNYAIATFENLFVPRTWKEDKSM